MMFLKFNSWVGRRSTLEIIGLYLAIPFLQAAMAGSFWTHHAGHIMVQQYLLWIWMPPFLLFIRSCLRINNGGNNE